MKINWIIIAIIYSLVGGVITYFLTGDWKISLVSTVVIFVIMILNNPIRRYMKAFYVVLFPLLSNIYFTFASKTENFDMKIGIKELDIATTVILGLIAVTCLILDYLERSGKWHGNIISINRNSNKGVSGNVNINQTIYHKDSTKDD